MSDRVEIKVAGATVEVRTLRWRDGMEFLKRFTAHFKNLVRYQDGKPVMDLDTEQLPELIASATDLCEFLVRKSTGQDDAWIDDRTPVEILEVLNAAIPLNLSPRLFDVGKATAGAVGAALGLDPKASAAPSTSSSPRATASPTSK